MCRRSQVAGGVACHMPHATCTCDGMTLFHAGGYLRPPRGGDRPPGERERPRFTPPPPPPPPPPAPGRGAEAGARDRRRKSSSESGLTCHTFISHQHHIISYHIMHMHMHAQQAHKLTSPLCQTNQDPTTNQQTKKQTNKHHVMSFVCITFDFDYEVDHLVDDQIHRHLPNNHTWHTVG